MTENDYLLAWGLYAFAALGCLLVWFRLTRWMWRWLREPLRVAVAVLLFTPTIVDPGRDLFAPAIAISALDLAFKVGSNVLRAASDLAMYGMFAFVAYLLFVLVRWPLERNARARREAAEAAAQQRANALEEQDQPFTSADPGRYRNEPPASSGSVRVEPRL